MTLLFGAPAVGEKVSSLWKIGALRWPLRQRSGQSGILPEAAAALLRKPDVGDFVIRADADGKLEKTGSGRNDRMRFSELFMPIEKMPAVRPFCKAGDREKLAPMGMAAQHQIGAELSGFRDAARIVIQDDDGHGRLDFIRKIFQRQAAIVACVRPADKVDFGKADRLIVQKPYVGVLQETQKRRVLRLGIVIAQYGKNTFF